MKTPPYLRADNPTDLAKIQKEINRLREESRKKHNLPKFGVDLKSSTSIAIKLDNIKAIVENDPNSPSSTNLDSLKLKITSKKDASVEKGKESKKKDISLSSKEISTNSAARVSSLIDVSPSGNVNMGLNCAQTFTATYDSLADYITWFIQYFNPNTNQPIGGLQYLGDTDNKTVDFKLDHNSYQSLAVNGKLGFIVFCKTIYLYVVYPEVWYFGPSNQVIMNFTGPSCAGLHSVALNPSSFKGGDSDIDKSVTITVTLDTVAPPGGKLVTLNVIDNNLIQVARLVAGNTFMIPEGQQSESLSWFLGTKKVKKTKDFKIKVSIDSVNNSVGYIDGSVTKD